MAVAEKASVRASSEKGGDSRERILAAALEDFSHQGFEGATTRDIANRAGVNVGLIKYYFDSKLKLWRAAVDRAFERLHERIDGILEEGESLEDRDRIEALIRSFIRFVAHNPEFARLMHDEGKRRGPRMRWIVDRHVKSIYDYTTRMIERARDRGELPAHIDPAHFHYILVGAIALIFHQAEECERLSGLDLTDDRVIEAHADAVIHLFLGRPASP